MSIFDVEIEEKLAVIWLDQENSAVNSLNVSALRALNDILDDLAKDAGVRALVLISRKEDSFVVGADINEFQAFETPEEALQLVQEGQALFERIEHFSKPIVAAVHGPCVGGGLELILACHYRLASTHKRTLFALPEVKLGLLPGLGGTQRLPKLVGLQKGLSLILTGKNVYAKPAKKLGLLDALIHQQGLEDAAKRAALGLSEGSLQRQERKQKLSTSLLEKTPLNTLVYSKAAEEVEKNTRGNYPAPHKIIEAIRTGFEKGSKAGYKVEAEAFSHLLFTPESKALRHLFFAKNAAEKNPLKDKAKPVATVGVLGAGLMGSGIAQVSAQKAYDVLLKDQTLEFATKGKAAIYKDVSKRVGKGLSPFERDQIVGRVLPTEDYKLFPADITIEAVLEILDLKQKVLREIEDMTPEGHIFASNTSSIPIQDIAAAAERPEAVLGMHYFSPVPKMPLIEIIRTEKTADWALATAIEVGLQQGKTIIVVGDTPGFYVNRILAPYINEALLLLQEGASIEAIDEAMLDFGFPVGPLKLLDEVGIDVGSHVTTVMRPLFQARGIELVQPSKDILEAGMKGRKSGKGFYTYDKGKRKEANKDIYRFFTSGERQTIPKGDIQERLFLAMVNEAVYTLEEAVIASAQDGDVGAVFGIGFPPFFGGPFFYLDQQGAGAVLTRIQTLVQRCGPRFTPSALLSDHAKEDKAFYS